MSNLSEVWDWDCTEIGKSLQLDLLPVRTFKIVCHSLSLKVKLEDMYFASMWWYGIIHIYISPNVFVDSANFPYLLSTPFKENRIVFSVKTSFDCLSPRHISSCSPQHSWRHFTCFDAVTLLFSFKIPANPWRGSVDGRVVNEPSRSFHITINPFQMHSHIQDSMLNGH